MMVSRREYVCYYTVNQGGTAKDFSSLTVYFGLSGLFYFSASVQTYLHYNYEYERLCFYENQTVLAGGSRILR